MNILNKKTVEDLKVQGKRVLVRCDFNVPLKNGVITDENRIVAALPTIKYLMSKGAKVILCSHLGKVKEGPNEKESLAPVAKRLEELLGKKKYLHLDNYENVVVGSDQLWLPVNIVADYYTLNWVSDKGDSLLIQS